MFENIKIRHKLLRSGCSEEATEMFVYINICTRKGTKGIEVLEKQSLVNKLQIGILKKLKLFKPFVTNFQRLYNESEYRQKWFSQYQEYSKRFNFNK